MDLRFTPEEVAFRDEMRTFFRANIPETTRNRLGAGRHVGRDAWVESQQILNKAGLAVPHWPVQHGGRGWSPIQLYIYNEEMLKENVPAPLPFGTHMVGPVIIAFGTEEQKAHYLPRIANMDDWWCQGFSEPGAGSDLASLKCRAVRDGDHYVINGQKTWTTLAQWANWIFVLARTNPEARKPQEGISFILVDMKTLGVTVRPIQLIDGEAEVNEVWFDDVRVPVANLVGQENRGWDCAKFLLGNERSNIARIGASKSRLKRIREIARAVPAGDGALWDDMGFRRRVNAVEVELKALEMTQLRVVADERDHGNKPNPASLDPEDQGLGNPAGDDRVGPRDGRPVRAGLSRRRTRYPGGFQRPAGRFRLGRHGCTRILQLSQGVDLRRIERDTAQHHRQDGAGFLMHFRALPDGRATCCRGDTGCRTIFVSGP